MPLESLPVQKIDLLLLSRIRTTRKVENSLRISKKRQAPLTQKTSTNILEAMTGQGWQKQLLRYLNCK